MNMTPIKLEQQLRSQFDIKCIYDLGKMSQSPKTLFKALSDVYQARYKQNDRIVF